MADTDADADADVERHLNDHVFAFDFQPGWVDLTLEDGDWVDAWAAATVVAATQFESGKLKVKGRRLVRDLRRRAIALNAGAASSAAAYYTPEGRAVADLRTDWYGEDDEPRPAPADVVPLLLDWSNGEISGEPDIRYLDLPYGPAARVQATVTWRRRLGLGLGLGFGRRTAQFIKYAIFPPGANDLCVVWVTWWSEQDSDEVVRLTDELVAGMRLVPPDADGGESPTND